MVDHILEILKVSRNNGLTKEEVFKKLAYTNLSFSDFEEVFDDLREKHKIYQTSSDKYTLNPFKEGEVKVTKKGDILVKTNDETYFITEDQFNCTNGDLVKIRVTDFNEMTATIKEVIDRKGIIAEIKTIKNKKYAVTNDEKMYEIETNLVDGIIVGIKLEKERKGKLYARIDREFGHKNRPRIDEETILYENNFDYTWNDEIKEELKSVPSQIKQEDTKDRKDLRNEMIFTIDGDDTKDIDDAISLEITDDGYILGVHIADVTNYVKDGSALDKEARARGTSVYMNSVVNPMYPVELSNGICSLNPNVDRLALSCSMKMDKNGNIKSYDIFESVIKSNIQMTYKKVNKILDGETVEGYEPYIDTLNNMYELSLKLIEKRSKRGYQAFDIPEMKVITDDEGRPTEIKKRESGKGEKLIEMFMLEANETVATYIYGMDIPFIYRDHDTPHEEKLRKVTNVIKSYGEKIDVKGNLLSSKYIEDLLKSLEKSDKKETYSSMILRSLSKATYEAYNIGHFSIGIDATNHEAYTHFTSPIRRYPDTTVHRIVKMVLHKDMNTLYSEEFKNKIAEIAAHSSVQEQNAETCERQSNKMKSAEYLAPYIGEKYQATISGFTTSGMYVMLDNLIEGRVGYNTMDDYYNYDENLETLTGERSKKIYRLGDKVNVVLTKASKELKEIDFEIIKGDK